MAKQTSVRRKGSNAQSAMMWDEASNATSLLALLPIISELRRKRRMCALSCCRLVWDSLDPHWQNAVEASLQAEAGQCGEEQRQAAVNQALTEENVHEMSNTVRWALGPIVSHLSLRSVVEGIKRSEQAELLRDIFGNPFRPVAIDPRWLSSTVLDLADLIYNERAFDRMPILADALMDAGCDSEEIIKHCQGPGPHVRGCWLVDLLLGKS